MIHRSGAVPRGLWRLQEEQDYVQAYENVREKYKGKEAILHLVDILEQVNSEW